VRLLFKGFGESRVTRLAFENQLAIGLPGWSRENRKLYEGTPTARTDARPALEPEHGLRWSVFGVEVSKYLFDLRGDASALFGRHAFESFVESHELPFLFLGQRRNLRRIWACTLI
jgi:hypothetical protein